MVFKSKFSSFVIIIYYLIHRNIIIGWLYKNFFDHFFYKRFKFRLIKSYIPTSNYSSFFFKTYEINDRVIIERNISENNKDIFFELHYNLLSNKQISKIFSSLKKINLNLKISILILFISKK